MKTYREIADSVFERRDAYIAQKRKRMAALKRLTAAASGICIAVIAGLIVWKGSLLSGNTDMLTEDRVIAEITDPSERTEMISEPGADAPEESTISETDAPVSESPSADNAGKQDMTEAEDEGGFDHYDLPAASGAENTAATAGQPQYEAGTEPAQKPEAEDSTPSQTPEPETEAPAVGTELADKNIGSSANTVNPTEPAVTQPAAEEEDIPAVTEATESIDQPVVTTPIAENESVERPVLTTTAAASGSIGQTTTTVTFIDDFEIPKWDEMTITEQFTKYTPEGYTGKYYVKNIILDESIIGYKVADVTFKGYDVYTDTHYYKDAEVYKINGIAEECGLAVKYEGTDVYYTSQNFSYRPKTLGELIEGMNLDETLGFGNIYTRDNSLVYYDVDDGTIWNMLLTDGSPENIAYTDYPQFPNKQLGISIYVPVLGVSNLSLTVDADGYLWTNISMQGSMFCIGKDKTDAFVEYVEQNYEAVPYLSRAAAVQE